MNQGAERDLYPPPALLTHTATEGCAETLTNDEIRMLTEVGFLAAGHGYTRQATQIFNALRRLRPARAFPLIGLAITWLNAGQAERAAQILSSAKLDNVAESTLCAVWAGFALQQNGQRHASLKVLDSVLSITSKGASSEDRQLARLARALLGRPPEDGTATSEQGERP